MKPTILQVYQHALAEILVLDIDKKIMMTVDPNSELLDAINHQTGEIRSNTMDEKAIDARTELDPEDDFDDLDDEIDDLDDEIDFYDEEEDPRNLRNFLSKLESFLDSEFDKDSRGNVFMTKNGDGVSLNILVGAHFEECDEEINQVNIIVCPTDRSLLGSTGVSMDDREYPEDDDEEEDSTRHEAFNEALKIVE